MANFFGPSSGGEGSFDEFLARYLQGQNTPRQGRSVDINRLLSKRTREVVDGAAEYSRRRGQEEVDALHLLRVMVDSEHGSASLRQVGADDDDDSTHP